MSRLAPQGDRVLVEPEKSGRERTTAGGIILPNVKQTETVSGKVLAVGPGRVLDTGETSPMSYVPGETIVFGKYAGVKIEYRGEEYLFLRESDIIAKDTSPR